MLEQLQHWAQDPILGTAMTAAIGVLVIWLAALIIRRSVTRYVGTNERRYLARKGINFLAYLLIGLFLASVFSDRLGQLSVILGVAGAGIAFAMQEVIVSIAGWVAIVFNSFFRVGDRVQLGGIKGDVIDIGVIRTTLMECGDWVKGDLYNGRIVRIANSFVFKEPVFNYSGDFPFLWDEIILPVRYGSDYEMARKTFEQVLEEEVGDYARFAAESWREMVKKYMIEDARVTPMVSMAANDNWVEFTLRYVVDYKKRRWTKDRLFTRLLREIDQSQGKIVLGSATFELVGLPQVQVKSSA